MTAPEGSEIVAIERTEDMEGDLAIRITTDENAPLYRAVNWAVCTRIARPSWCRA